MQNSATALRTTPLNADSSLKTFQQKLVLFYKQSTTQRNPAYCHKWLRKQAHIYNYCMLKY